MLKVTFFGVRGSTPCCGPHVDRYGGNTACVVLEVPGEDPIVCDMGTGLRAYGATQPVDGSYRGTALVSHLHWDHVQGLPFFPPVLVPGARFDVYAPVQEDGRSVREAFDFFMQPPYFPIRVADLPSDITMLDCPEGEMKVGTALVTARLIPHIGNTLGYRITWGGATVAYLPDHQQPLDGSLSTTDAVLELADGVDLLIHDAQYTPPEFARKSHWGHCTHEYAVFVAKEAGAKRLALFHHDPARDDDVARRGAPLSAASSKRDRGIGRGGARRRRGPDDQLRRGLSSGHSGGSRVALGRHVRLRLGPLPPRARPLPDRRHDHHRGPRVRARRPDHRVVHVGVARPSARRLPAGEGLHDVARHRGGEEPSA